MTPVLAFDIETVPDCAGIRRLHDLPDSLSDAEVAEVAFQRRRTQTGHDFLPPHLHRVIVISCVLRDDEGVRAFSIGEPERDERAAIQKFFDGIEKLTPQLVSWNGGGFDLPVLQLRGLLHGVTAPRYWDLGDEDRDFRYNNYIGRYHSRHLDLMDVMGLYQPRNNAPLDEVAQLAGLPGKIGLSGESVWSEYLAGGITRIREYCEADCANTYLLWLRFQKMRGAHSAEQHALECAQVRDWIATQQAPSWREFLSRWQSD
ncbi:MAG TPA: 3'-5' exonuclease [Burkholderiales bacterium]|nr:3'-5' exonuclease [Burkholderiales bacterium]